MSNYHLYIDLEYTIEQDKYKVNTNVKQEHLCDLVSTFLSNQMGKGADPRKAEEREVYHIRIEINLEQDDFLVRDNTGNLGLRDGILLNFLSQHKRD